MYFISSVAEELLAFTNIIPEWLCKDRQEKVFDLSTKIEAFYLQFSLDSISQLNAAF